MEPLQLQFRVLRGRLRPQPRQVCAGGTFFAALSFPRLPVLAAAAFLATTGCALLPTCHRRSSSSAGVAAAAGAGAGCGGMIVGAVPSLWTVVGDCRRRRRRRRLRLVHASQHALVPGA